MAPPEPPSRPVPGKGSRRKPWALPAWLLTVLLGIVFVLVIVVFVFRIVSYPEQPPAVCLSNTKNIALAVQMYLADNDEAFPPAADWCDRLEVYIGNRDVYRCPRAEGLDCGFAYNAALDEVSLDDVPHPARTIVIFESDAGWNASGGRELLPDEPRHEMGDNYGFADGSARWMERRRLGESADGRTIWAKEPADESVIWVIPEHVASEER